MLFQFKNNQTVLLRHFTIADTEALLSYLHQLSDKTKKRFGPHRFDVTSIKQLFQDSSDYLGFIAIASETNTIIAYSIIKIGFLEHDQQRLENYGLTLNQTTDCTFAPSVADNWQSSGVGTAMLNFILEYVRLNSIQRIILWGGVQIDNEKAVRYYLKNHFSILGEFEYNGRNYDMMYKLD